MMETTPAAMFIFGPLVLGWLFSAYLSPTHHVQRLTPWQNEGRKSMRWDGGREKFVFPYIGIRNTGNGCCH